MVAYIVAFLAVLFFLAEAFPRLELEFWPMAGALALLLGVPLLIIGFLRILPAVLGRILGVLFAPFILLFARASKTGATSENESQEQPGGERTFSEAIETVRYFESLRKQKGFKPGWLFFQCKEDEQLLEALEYLRSIGEIPKQERSNGNESHKRHKTSGSKHQHQSDSSKQKEERSRFDPYEILGVKPNASPDEIRSSYRDQMKLYHPDRVNHLGDALKELALQRTKDIQRAFETLMPQT